MAYLPSSSTLRAAIRPGGTICCGGTARRGIYSSEVLGDGKNTQMNKIRRDPRREAREYPPDALVESLMLLGILRSSNTREGN